MNCLGCPPGSHTDKKEKATQCTPCPPGTFSDVPGFNCTKCVPGTASPGGQTFCHECFSGYYMDKFGYSACLPCPSLALDSLVGSSVCDRAAVDYFLDPTAADGVVSSLPCPSGGRCEGGVQLPRPHADYWIDRSSFKRAKVAHKCFRSTCLGARKNEIVNTSCWMAAKRREARTHCGRLMKPPYRRPTGTTSKTRARPTNVSARISDPLHDTHFWLVDE
jgi:hypothetical protein